MLCGGKLLNGIGSRFRLQHEVAGCVDVYFDGVRRGIPAVFFDSLTPPPNPSVTLDGRSMEINAQYYPGGTAQEVFVQIALTDTVCQSMPAVTGKPPYVVVGAYKNELWLHDPRFSFFENTIDAPKADGGGANVKSTTPAVRSINRAECSSVPMNFLNEASCFLSNDPNVCASIGEQSGSIALTFANFERVFAESSSQRRYIYATKGLRQDPAESTVPYPPPCTVGARSRWVPVNDCSFDIPGVHTSDVFVNLILLSTEKNPYMRDIIFPVVGASCDAVDSNIYNFRVLAGGQCWQNVHQSHLQVYDFTDWAGINGHPGGSAAIAQFAVSGNFTLTFPG
jgi:hypothetical protein